MMDDVNRHYAESDFHTTKINSLALLKTNLPTALKGSKLPSSMTDWWSTRVNRAKQSMINHQSNYDPIKHTLRHSFYYHGQVA